MIFSPLSLMDLRGVDKLLLGDFPCGRGNAGGLWIFLTSLSPPLTSPPSSLVLLGGYLHSGEGLYTGEGVPPLSDFISGPAARTRQRGDQFRFRSTKGG